MDQRIDLIAEALKELLAPETILLRNDSPMRKAEGLEPENRILHGCDPGPVPLTTGGLQFEVDLLSGQKTGLYLDQLDAYERVARLAAGKRVLDCFSNQGGFGLACAKAGAAAVTCVDISADAVAAVKSNAERNDVEINALEANAFDFLKSCEESYDLIILDPPSFTRSKKTLGDAMRGYKEIHLRALKLLDHDGYLSTFSCSHHVTRELFLSNICAAAVDAKRTLRLVESHAQREDHPVLPTIPETEYLKGFTFQLLPGR
jgi:23S rRNA (cytosine1962-C5)-methyltransferase